MEKPMKKIDKYCFCFDDKLGQGAFGTVYQGKDYSSSIKYAIKAVPVDLINSNPDLNEAIKNEMEVMKLLKHKNIVNCYDVLTTANNYYFVMELCNGGTLTSYLKKKRRIPEYEALTIIKQILSGYYELLKLGIVHRDLKPDNILISDNIYKIADFGFAKSVDNFKKALLKTSVGTPLYMSPQILTQTEYTTKSDLWSIALIYYELLVGRIPWEPKSQYDLVQKINKEPVTFPKDIEISDDSKDFIIGALKIEEKERFGWDEVFSHRLFQDCFQFNKRRNTLKEGADYFKNILMQKIVQNNVDLSDLFKKIDKNGNGELDINEFSFLLKKLDKNIEREQIEFIYNSIDEDGNNAISLLEFRKWLSGIKNKQTTQIDENLVFSNFCDLLKNNGYDISLIFQKFDINGSGTMDKYKFCQMMQVLNKDLQHLEMDMLFKKFDIHHTGEITLQMFQHVLYPSYSSNSIQSYDYMGNSPHKQINNNNGMSPPHENNQYNHNIINQNQPGNMGSQYSIPSMNGIPSIHGSIPMQPGINAGGIYAGPGAYNNYYGQNPNFSPYHNSPSPNMNYNLQKNFEGFHFDLQKTVDNNIVPMNNNSRFNQGNNNEDQIAILVNNVRNYIYKSKSNVEIVFRFAISNDPYHLSETDFMRLLGMLNINVNQYECSVLFQAFDLDRDGRISLEEFKRIILNI